MFLSSLPGLQYSADAAIVTLLLKAPLYFNLEMYNSVPRLEKVGVKNNPLKMTPSPCFNTTKSYFKVLLVNQFSMHLLPASGPAAVSVVWDRGEAHGGHCAAGLRHPVQRPLCRQLHLLLPLSPGLQPAAGRPDRVLQLLPERPAAGESVCQWSSIQAKGAG